MPGFGAGELEHHGVVDQRRARGNSSPGAAAAVVEARATSMQWLFSSGTSCRSRGCLRRRSCCSCASNASRAALSGMSRSLCASASTVLAYSLCQSGRRPVPAAGADAPGCGAIPPVPGNSFVHLCDGDAASVKASRSQCRPQAFSAGASPCVRMTCPALPWFRLARQRPIGQLAAIGVARIDVDGADLRLHRHFLAMDAHGRRAIEQCAAQRAGCLEAHQQHGGVEAPQIAFR